MNNLDQAREEIEKILVKYEVHLIFTEDKNFQLMEMKDSGGVFRASPTIKMPEIDDDEK